MMKLTEVTASAVAHTVESRSEPSSPNSNFSKVEVSM